MMSPIWLGVKNMRPMTRGGKQVGSRKKGLGRVGLGSIDWLKPKP